MNNYEDFFGKLEVAAPSYARLVWKYFDELCKVGFSREESLVIVSRMKITG